MKRPVDQIESYSDWPQDRKRMRRNGGPRGSPLPSKRTAERVAPQRLSDLTVFDGHSNGGTLTLAGSGIMDKHATTATKALRSSLSVTYKALEDMLKEHRNQMASLERKLAEERSGKDELRQEIAATKQTLATDREQLRSEQKLTADLRKELSHRELDCLILKGDVDLLRREAVEHKRKIQKYAAELEQSKAQTEQLRQKFDTPTRVINILQDGRFRRMLWYDYDVDFRTVLESYAQDTNQHASRLIGRCYQTSKVIGLSELFIARFEMRTDSYIVSVEVTDVPSAKKRRLN